MDDETTPPETAIQATARKLGASAVEELARLLAFDHALVQEGTDGQGYYTLMYRNGEAGPRSEGYADGPTGARDAVLRDFAGLLPVRMPTVGDASAHGDG